VTPEKFSALQVAAIREFVYREGLRAFCKIFWNDALPGEPFQPTWHIDAIATHLEAVSCREIKRLVISMPPRAGKTVTVNVLWPAWHWTIEPRHAWMTLSYSDRLMQTAARQSLNVIRSERYANAWPEIRLPNQLQIANFRNTAGGKRMSASVGGQIMGAGSNTQVVDDPIGGDDIHNKKAHELAWERWGWLSTRIDGHPDDFARVVVMQRLAVDDLAGRCLDEGYEHLCLPLVYTPNAFWDRGSCLGKLDPREVEGALLSERWSQNFVEEQISVLGPAQFSAQYQQNPVPSEGNIIETAWLERTYETIPDGARWIQSWDFGFKGPEAGRSRTHGLLLAIVGEKAYVVDEFEPRVLNYPNAKRLFTDQQKDPNWKRARAKYVEAKANGIAILDDLKDDVPGMISVEPKGSKEERLYRHSDAIRAGYLLLPEEKNAPWIKPWKFEIVAFPRGAHDDRVDTLTQGLDQTIGTDSRFRAFLKTDAFAKKMAWWARGAGDT